MEKNIKEVDVVFVGLDHSLLKALAMQSASFNKEADTYQDPQHFLDNVHRYPKHTRIVLGQRFANFAKKGTQIAEYLHEVGFTHLYLFSFQEFSKGEIPEYLTVFVKPDISGIERMLRDIPKKP